jgi:glycosyltransferase involved in cell wall biosynthesis
MPKKIVLVSSGQPSLNPRLVKEADALSDAGYDVTVLYAYWNDWGTEYDKELLATKKWEATRIGGSPQHNRAIYFFSRLSNAASRLVIQKTGAINRLANYAISRSSYFLIKEVKKHKADLYIAHNLGALPAVVTAAKANNSLCGFDAEDFHRHETSDDVNNYDVVLKSRIEDKYIPQVNYFTTSSVQIAEAYQQIFTGLKPVVLLNVFPKDSISAITLNNDKPLKLFWFSQTIGANRGISDIVKALQLLDKTRFELHLLGSILPGTEAFINEISNSGIVLKLHATIPPDQLTHFASQFDIGVALEPGFSINNNLALSNKLFTYMQAGLAVIASDTTAQQDFMSKNPRIGSVYPIGNAEALAAILLNYDNNRDILNTCKTEALRLANEQYNWDIERLKFLEVIKNTLTCNSN